MFDLYPDTGPLRRELYAKHMAFFAAGRDFQERGMIAANRVGKTFGAGGYETTLHLTGLYPDWWEGHRFDGPTDVWAVGTTSETTRDIVQQALTGVGGETEEGALGTGLIPGDLIVGSPSKRHGVTGAFDTMMVRHHTGGLSKCGFKAYDQKRKKFEGTAKHVIWCDEEPPVDIYTECMTRLMTLNGIMLVTFTPMEGMTAVATMYWNDLAMDKA